MASKKGKGKVIGLIVIMMFVGALVFGITQIVKNPEQYQSGGTNDNLVFDAMKFYESKDATISEDKLIEMLGQPDEIEEWDYKTETKSYPVKSLRYEKNENSMSGYTYSYNFNSDMLQRITIDGIEYSYTDKKDILSMFGLKKYANSAITDTGVAYRITNCGVHDLWITELGEKTLKGIRITYGTMYGE